MKSGIYIITNTANKKCYVGKDVGIPGRWHNHRRLLRKGLHKNSHLQNSWNKYGESAFHWEILEYCEPRDLKERERWWMCLLDLRNPNKGYNKFDPIDGRLGMKNTAEHRTKISDSLKGRSLPEGHKIKLSESKKGRSWTEARRKAQEYKPWSKVSIEAMVNVNIKTWEVICPEGITMIIKGLKGFCRKNNLNYVNMINVSNGRMGHYEGWKVRRI